MFGSTTLVLGSQTLNKINSPAYASEYMFANSVEEKRVKVRHSKTKAGFDRHNVEVTQTVFGASGAPDVTRKAYVTFEIPPGDGADGPHLTALLCNALVASTNAGLVELVAWVV